MMSETQGTRTQTATNFKKKKCTHPFLNFGLFHFKTIYHWLYLVMVPAMDIVGQCVILNPIEVRKEKINIYESDYSIFSSFSKLA